MILLDTHTWIWWMADPQKLSSKATEAIHKAANHSAIGVSAISCWEIAMLVAKGRLGLTLDVEEWIEKSLKLPEVKLVELSPKISVLSTRLEGNPPNDPADKILIATAKAHSCPLVTRDQKILDYPHIKTIW